MGRNTWFLGLVVVPCLAAPLGATTYTVTNTADSGIGSLRWAITQANTNFLVSDLIDFNIGGGGAWTITPLSALPALIDPVGDMIDGLTQPGASAGANPPSTATLLIEIDGSFAGFSNGLELQSDNNQVRGLVVNRFQRDGIYIVGGVANPSADFNMVTCNFVGTDLSGSIDLGNGTNMGSLHAGIHIGNVPGGQAVDNTVDGNLVSGNWAEGVWVEGPRQPGMVSRNYILHCYIGTDATGTIDLGNDHEGVALTEGTTDNEVLHNLISGNDTDGVGIQGFNNLGFGPPIQTSRNLIESNLIGVDTNLAPLPNTMQGVTIGEYGGGRWGCADQNTVRRNVIAFNQGTGVAVWEDAVNNFNADQNEITRNAIYANGGLGIDLKCNGVTLNDPGDVDQAPNQELNFPVISSITYVAGMTTVTGTLAIDSNPSLARVEVFFARPDGSGYGEGEWHLGSTTPDAAGNWSFSTIKLAPGDLVTCTATDAATNTSEFCQNVVVPGSPALSIDNRTLAERVGGTVNFTLNAGVVHANRSYMLFGSASGISPGTPLPGRLVVLPLNWDAMTTIVFKLSNSPALANFRRTLDGSGQATAQMNTFGPLPSGTIGVILYFAFATAGPFDYVSNHVAVEVTPW